ncbi:MAG TPA: HMG-box domain-containing protein [Spirochaetota bacterium]|nr:HMG-box domain-containing protein [Spirochaetota bacterium]HPI91239.1 HMG-box domain-containing protein [Spirochaetota bacterium]HPR49896.1 HMG-box domain-containing protein [Spirochaetota bacterium]
MATIALNPILTSISGTTGRLVFYTRNNKTIARALVKPRNPDTPAQRANRDRFRQAMASWKGLSDDEKNAYNHKAKRTGMTGHNLYISGWMKNRAQKTDTKPVLETFPGYVADPPRNDEIYRRRVSRYAPTKEPSSPCFYPSVTAPSSPRVSEYALRDMPFLRAGSS